MILICFGTRPEWLKIKPILKYIDSYELLFTGQHPQLLSEISFDYTINISEGDNRLDQVLSSCMLQFPNHDYESVLVHGDTASAFGCALAAYSRRKKVIHLEAGLRTHDLNHPYPEEGYRQMISRIADINFAPTLLSASNLFKENVVGKTYVVGNSVLDNLVDLVSKVTYGSKVLVTLHRWENHPIMQHWFEELEKAANQFPDLEFILPIHPNPNVQKHRYILNKVKVVDPLPHEGLLDILTECRFVITDSGGIQEEATFLNKKVIVCRNTTERPEGKETGHLYICDSPFNLLSYIKELNNSYEISSECPYGDGHTGEKVAKILTGL